MGVVATIAMALVALAGAQDPAASAFTEAVANYLTIRGEAAAGLKLSDGDPVSHYSARRALARKIAAKRAAAKAGDLFGPAAPRIREIITGTIHGPQGKAVFAAIAETNTVASLRVNERYPDSLPRATMPGVLLRDLPPLPTALEYRFLGRSLLLLDADAQLVIDVLPDALPQRVR